MIKTTLGMVSVATALLLAASFANVSAQTKKSDAQSPACNQLKDHFFCMQGSRRLPVGGSRRDKEGRLHKGGQKEVSGGRCAVARPGVPMSRSSLHVRNVVVAGSASAKASGMLDAPPLQSVTRQQSSVKSLRRAVQNLLLAVSAVAATFVAAALWAVASEVMDDPTGCRRRCQLDESRRGV